MTTPMEMEMFVKKHSERMYNVCTFKGTYKVK